MLDWTRTNLDYRLQIMLLRKVYFNQL
ncbi:MAG: hypothetical protein ACHQF4_08040 [Sphingobacteriales bacterium]